MVGTRFQLRDIGTGIFVVLLLVLLVSSLSQIGVLIDRIPGVTATGSPPVLGVDCGLGTIGAVVPPPPAPQQMPYPPLTGDGALDTACTWSGDADAFGGSPSDGTLEPLVSDKPETFASYGGGFAAEVRATGLSTSPNGFDITMTYDTRFLDAVLIDGKGLAFGDSPPFGDTVFPVNVTINHAAGIIRVALLLLGSPTPGPDVTLFRVRFDVLAVGTAQLSFVNSIITDPGQVNPKIQSATFDSEPIFDPLAILNWQASWTYLPSPEIPGTPLNLTATVLCPGCVGSLSYVWDTNSDGVSDASGRTVVITAPTTTLKVNRVTLNVTDTVGNRAQVFKRLPLTMVMSGASTLTTSTSGRFDGLWLGGIPNYTGNWRLCPGSSSQTLVCTNPAPTLSSTAGQNSTQSVTYHFSGVYNNTFKITDTAAPQISTTPTTVSRFTVVNVTGIPAAFTVTIVPSPMHPEVGSSVNLTATIAYDSSYPTGAGFRSTSFKYSFSFGDLTTVDVSGGTSVKVSKAYTATGDFTIRVTAQDTSTPSKIQETGWLSVSVTPQLTGAFTFSSVLLQTGQTVSFSGTASGGMSPYSFAWDFGDSSTGTGITATHTYNAAGTYTVKLTVTDAFGNQKTTTQTVKITAAPAQNNPAIIYGGIGAGVVAAIALLVLLRRRRRPTKALPTS